jgi:hypothetical protein
MKYSLGVLLCIAIVLLIIDRQLRINPFLQRANGSIEGMANNGTRSRVGTRCGTDLYPCPPPLRCGNGMCISEEMTMPIEANPLPVLP